MDTEITPVSIFIAGYVIQSIPRTLNNTTA